MRRKKKSPYAERGEGPAVVVPAPVCVVGHLVVSVFDLLRRCPSPLSSLPPAPSREPLLAGGLLVGVPVCTAPRSCPIRRRPS